METQKQKMNRKIIAELMRSPLCVRAHVVKTNDITESYFFLTPENIANFIGQRPFAYRIILTTMDGDLILNTFNNRIDSCRDHYLRREVEHFLKPIQSGATAVGCLYTVPAKIAKEYFPLYVRRPFD